MCGILTTWGGCAKKACRCLCLRTFAISWLSFSLFLGIMQLVIGSYFASAKVYINEVLEAVARLILKMEDPTTAMQYYQILQDSFATLWNVFSLLTSLRGVIDLLGVSCWVFGLWRKKVVAMYIFIGVMAVDFFLDFCLFVICIIVFSALYVAYFYPISIIFPFAVYGWQIFAGPFILHFLMSYTNVLSVGGNGTEMKSWKEIQEMNSKVDGIGSETVKSELQPLVSDFKRQEINAASDGAAKDEDDTKVVDPV